MSSHGSFLSIPQAVERLRGAGLTVSASQVRRWVRKGQLPAIVLPNGRAQVRPEDVDALLAAPAAS
jgi:predicted site-specific integrase-resolvase